MNILVTNDDGIDSAGIWALAEAMNRVGNVTVIAPEKQQSGAGTSLSLHSGISINEVSSPIEGVDAYAIGGTPSDCVILGLRKVMNKPVDLLVSGINLGANVGNDILYSGTVMATLQGFLRKIPSIAVSLVIQNSEDQPRFDIASKVTEFLALRIKNDSMPTEAIINTNVPNIAPEEIKGITTTRAAASGYHKLSGIKSTSGMSHYTSSYLSGKYEVDEGTDIWAINNNMISITPLRPAVTHHELIPVFTEHIPSIESDLLSFLPDK